MNVNRIEYFLIVFITIVTSFALFLGIFNLLLLDEKFVEAFRNAMGG